MWTSLVLASLLAVLLRPPCMAQSINRDSDVTHKPSDWYETSCKEDRECGEKNAECFMGTCLCRFGFYLSTDDYTCSSYDLSACSQKELENDFSGYPDSRIRRYYIQQNRVSFEECRNLCVSNTRCLSFDFRVKGGRCQIHYITSREASSGWYRGNNKGWTHYQRTCRKTPELVPVPQYNASCHNDVDCVHPYTRCLSGRCSCALGSFTIKNKTVQCATAKTCVDWQKSGAKSGAYFIRLTDNHHNHSHDHRVWCDMESGGGGWLVFQRRRDGSVDFYRKWEEYERGFGDVSKEFWLGLATLHRLTKGRPTRLRVDLGEVNGNRLYAEYSSFRVHGPETNYTLAVSGYSGNAGDSLRYHNDMSFSTYERDNDNSPGNCASYWYGAWWYKQCFFSELNSRYKADGAAGTYGIHWYHAHNDMRSFTFSEMKIKPV